MKKSVERKIAIRGGATSSLHRADARDDADDTGESNDTNADSRAASAAIWFRADCDDDDTTRHAILDSSISPPPWITRTAVWYP